MNGTEPGRASCYSHVREYALAAKARADAGGTQNYKDTHLIARLHLGLLDDAPVACAHCGVTDYHARLYAALNWPDIPADRLLHSERGYRYSLAAETDYIPLCAKCHQRMDFPGWSGIPKREAPYLRPATETDVIALGRSRHWSPEA